MIANPIDFFMNYQIIYKMFIKLGDLRVEGFQMVLVELES
jgi:hypothetical protein